MSVLGNLFNKILHRNPAAQPSPQSAPSSGGAMPQSNAQSGNVAQAGAATAGTQPQQQPSSPQVQAQPTQSAGAAPQQAGGSAAAMQPVDVEQVLSDMAAKNPQKLNWRTSIVDLMKLVGMESSLQERKELADELGYTGDKSDTATMNIWLHKQVMRKLAENGGKVPQDLLH